MDTLGGQAGHPGELLGADLGRQGLIGTRTGTDCDHERQVEQVHLQADLVRHPHQCRVRERTEVEVRQQFSGVVAAALVVWVDRVELGACRAGARNGLQDRVIGHLRVVVVDDDRPRAVRVTIGGEPGRPVNGPDLRPPIGRDGRRVERRILDVVAHATHVILAHRFPRPAAPAVVEVELSVPAIVHGVAEVHELRRCPDVELQALEDRDDVGTFVAQRLLHPPV